MYETENNKKISYVIPCYHSSQTLPAVVREITETMKTLPQYIYEVILVNDASPDDTWETIKKLVRMYKEFLTGEVTVQEYLPGTTRGHYYRGVL